MRKIPVIPASFFAIVLGTTGLGTAWRAGHGLWGLPAQIGEGFAALGVLSWAVLLVFYILKWITAPEAAKTEINDPVQAGFVALVGELTMIAALGILPYAAIPAAALFTLGAAVTVVFGLWRTGLMWRGGRQHASTTPALYLPLVGGSFIFSLGLSAFGHNDWAQLVFGAGFFSWLAIESVLLQRFYTADPLSEPLRPTLGIQLAPPAVGALAYVNASGTTGDMLVHAFIGYAILQALLLARMLPWITRRFVPSLWGFSFGATGLASVTAVLTTRGDTGAIATVAPIAFVAANLLVIGLIIGTVVLLFSGRLLPSRPVQAQPA